MKRNNNIILILVFICFALYVAIELKLPWRDAEKKGGEAMKRLQAENDSLRQNNLALDKKYNALELQIDSMEEKLITERQNIVQLKIKQHEKINSVDALTNDELFGFFSKFNSEGTSTK